MLLEDAVRLTALQAIFMIVVAVLVLAWMWWLG